MCRPGYVDGVYCYNGHIEWGPCMNLLQQYVCVYEGNPNNPNDNCVSEVQECHGCYTSSPSCFLAGTQITLADGTTTPIESLHRGDRVLSWDETASAAAVSEVVAIHTPRAEEVPSPDLLKNEDGVFSG
jgi:hypothetical protein